MASEVLGGTGYDGGEQWSDDQAMAALSSAGQAEFGAPEQAPQAAPEGETQQVAQPEVQPEAQVAPEPTETESFDGGKFNPDTLPPELQEGWKQLQAAFTQKTQELAAQRQQFEALGDPESLQQAVDLYNRIADPQNWQQLHAELTDAMQQMGMTPAEAEAAATEAITQQQTAESPFQTDDPELQPVLSRVDQLQQELESLRSEQQQERAMQEAERQYILQVQELQRQEAAIREAHPDWGDDKIAAAYEMSSFYNGNLAQAAARLGEILSAERELYLSQKAGAMQDSTRTPASTFAEGMTKSVEPETVREAEAAAMEEFMARVAELGE